MRSSLLLIMSASLAFLLMAEGCERSPVKRLVDPGAKTTAGIWSGQWAVYDDELKTGGTLLMFPSAAGQAIDLSWRENPRNGSRCIKYTWDGKAPNDASVGISFIVASSLDLYNTSSLDLTSGGYTRISFWVRGELNTNVFFRVESHNGNYRSSTEPDVWMSNTGTQRITSAWQHYEFTITGPLTAIKDFVKIVFRYDEDGNPDTPNTVVGNGGTVFLDDIQLLR